MEESSVVPIVTVYIDSEAVATAVAARLRAGLTYKERPMDKTARPDDGYQQISIGFRSGSQARYECTEATRRALLDDWRASLRGDGPDERLRAYDMREHGSRNPIRLLLDIAAVEVVRI